MKVGVKRDIRYRTECPGCGGRQVLYRLKKDGYWCRRCGAQWHVKPIKKKEKKK